MLATCTFEFQHNLVPKKGLENSCLCGQGFIIKWEIFYSYPCIHAPTDDVRHDVYLTMVSGVFNKGTKRADKNVEINVEILDDRDIVIPVCAVCCVLCASWVVPVCMLIVHASLYASCMATCSSVYLIISICRHLTTSMRPN